jgi:AcrR family transcriptional regulator
MPAEEVASHQRARIHFAMIEIVGERGYPAVTVRLLAQLAGVSTRTFYEHFRDKEECFLSTYDVVVQRAVGRIVASQEGESDWRQRLRLALTAFAHEVADRPTAARLALIEASGAGTSALEQMQRTEGIFEAMLSGSFSRAETQMPPLLIKGVVSGIVAVARVRLAAGREQELIELVEELLAWTLSIHGGGMTEVVELDRSASGGSTAGLTVGSRSQQNGRRSRDDDRPLILAAVTKLAAAKSYQQLTASRIRAAAGVSRRSFDSHFASVEDCFLAALEVRTAEMLEYAAGHTLGKGWPEDVSRAVNALCLRIADDPAFVALAFIEVFGAGTSAMRGQGEMAAIIAERFCASAPPAQRPRQLAAEASVGAVWALLRHNVASGKARQLQRGAPTLSYLMLAPAIGSPAAVEAVSGLSQ